jgi:hypothetical protein
MYSRNSLRRTCFGKSRTVLRSTAAAGSVLAETCANLFFNYSWHSRSPEEVTSASDSLLMHILKRATMNILGTFFSKSSKYSTPACCHVDKHLTSGTRSLRVLSVWDASVLCSLGTRTTSWGSILSADWVIGLVLPAYFFENG